VLLFSDRAKVAVNKMMLGVAIAMCTFATLSIAFQLRHVLDAFIWYHGPGGAVEEFENISYWVNVMQTVTYEIQTLIGDLILVMSRRFEISKSTNSRWQIYRCYVVYNRRWLVIALPLLVWTATLGISRFYITRPRTPHKRILKYAAALAFAYPAVLNSAPTSTKSDSFRWSRLS
jgi:hypothetical protein